MEDYEYSKEFPPDSDNVEFSPDEIEKIKRLFHGYKQDLQDNPRLIIPLASEIFNEMVAACELVVKEFSGKIKAKVDYSNYEATIEMWCGYVEFQQGEFMDVLHLLSENAKFIRFTPLVTGELYVQISMPYFVSAKTLLEMGGDSV